MRGELVVFGVDDQDRYADRLQLVAVDIRVGYDLVSPEGVEESSANASA